MKKSCRLLLLTTLILTLLTACVFGVACGEKDKRPQVSFNTNGGSAIAAVKVEKGTVYDLSSAIPQKSGYSFEGWYLDKALTGSSVTSVTVDKNITVYAKWAQTYKINLDTDEGTFAHTAIYLKEGANIYNFVSEYGVPTKNGQQFGCWYYEGAELTKSAKMPAKEITLVAKYKVAYSVEIYTKDLETQEYELEDTLTGYEYEGKTFVSEHSLEGFREVDNDNTVFELVINGDSSKNVFKHYFDREEYSVTFRPCYPDGTQGGIESFKAPYETPITVLYNYVCEGYCLIGWAVEEGGAVKYQADYVSSVLYGSEKTPTPDSFELTKNTTLYGVWAKGYTDMYGGDDYIYVFDATSDVVYLHRGNKFFQGAYYPKSQTFDFSNAKEDIFLSGKLVAEGLFAYYDDEGRSQITYTYTDAYGNTNENVTIKLGVYNEITYEEKVEDEIIISEGTFVTNEDGYFVATFTQGAMAEKGQMLFTLSSYNGEDVFIVRNENEVGLGQLEQFIVYNGMLTWYKDGIRSITLNGFGIAYFNYDGQQIVPYIYTLQDDMMTLYDLSSGSSQGVFKIFEHEGTRGYAPYDKKYDMVIENTDGSTLTLDGTLNVTYKNGDVEQKGYYSIGSSAFGGFIVTSVNGSKTYKYLVTITTTEQTVEVEGEDGQVTTKTEPVTVMSFEQKHKDYAEYYYQSAEGTYYVPLLVLNDPKEDYATLYGLKKESTTRVFVKLSSGPVIYNDTTKRYSYTPETEYDAYDEVLVSPYDLSTIESFIFDLDKENNPNDVPVMYWYSMVVEGQEEPTEYDVKYEEAGEGIATLVLVSGFAVYYADGDKIVGTYKVNGETMVITSSQTTVYLTINEEEKTFVRYQSVPYTSTVTVNGYTTLDKIYFDGMGGAIYMTPKTEVGEDGEEKIVVDEKGKVVYNEYPATFEVVDETTGVRKFIITDGETFNYIELYTSNARYVAKFSQDFNGEYKSVDGKDKLILDGYGYKAEYIVNGNNYDGYYYVDPEEMITVTIDDKKYYFDLTEDNKFTLRGDEFATYILTDNQVQDGTFISLDGYDKARIYVMEKTGTDASGKDVFEEREVAIGTYSQEDGVFTIVYTVAGEEQKLIGRLSTYAYNGKLYNTFVIQYKRMTEVYVNGENWTMLLLDDIGNATRITEKGVKEKGSYTIVTDNLLYYVNAQATDACLYDYDPTTKVATPKDFGEISYYTKELESLVFTQYGFAIFNGVTRYYYNVNKNNELLIYHYEPETQGANEYGYLETNFGQYKRDVIEYPEGKTYYKTVASSLKFVRGEEGEGVNNYPVLVSETVGKLPLKDLSFRPSGQAEFSVIGRVTVDKVYDCIVTRKVNEDTSVELYVTIGNFRFDIQVNYVGDGRDAVNTYTITGMKFIRALESNTYYDTLYMMYIYDMFLGSNMAASYTNNIGRVSFVTEYNEAGEEVAQYANGEFFEASAMYMLNDELVKLERVSYTYDEETGIYTIDIVEEHGTYHVYLVMQRNQYFSTIAYTLVALTYEQTMTTEDGVFTVTTERILASDAYSVGGYYTIDLMENGQKVEMTTGIIVEDCIYFINRTTDENGKITASKYYKLFLIENKNDAGMEGGEVVETKAPFSKFIEFRVETPEVKVVYAEDGVCFVEILNNEEVFYIYYGEKQEGQELTPSAFFGKKTTMQDGVYTVETYNGVNFSITVDGETVKIAIVVPEEPSEEPEEGTEEEQA